MPPGRSPRAGRYHRGVRCPRSSRRRGINGGGRRRGGVRPVGVLAFTVWAGLGRGSRRAARAREALGAGLQGLGGRSRGGFTGATGAPCSAPGTPDPAPSRPTVSGPGQSQALTCPYGTEGSATAALGETHLQREGRGGSQQCARRWAAPPVPGSAEEGRSHCEGT